MNRSYGRFVPHSRTAQFRRHGSDSSPSYPPRRSPAVSRPAYPPRRPAPVSRPVSRQSFASQARQKNGRSYWFPIATMMAAVLFAVTAVMPRSVFDAFAANEESFSFGIESKAGAYNVTVTGTDSTCIGLPAEDAEKTVNADGTVTFAVCLDEATDFTIDSPTAIRSIVFDNAPTAKAAENESDADVGDDGEESEEVTPQAGVEAVTGLDLSDSGATFVDVSRCVGLKTLYVGGNKALSDTACSNISFAADSNTEVVLETSEFQFVDRGEQGKGFLVKVTGAGDIADQTAILLGDIPVPKEGEYYFISFENLDATFDFNESAGAPSSALRITNSTQPGIIYVVPFSAGDVSEYIDPVTNPTTEPSGDNSDETTQSSTTPSGTDDGDAPNVVLKVEEKSKTIIKDAYIENVEGLKPGELKIVAKSLTSSNKKTFLNAIKKADKDFKDTNPCLIYDIYVVDGKGNKVDLKGKAAVTAILAYPEKQVEYNKEEYTYTVYHQLADKSVDTSIKAYPLKDGLQFTTDSFSYFAVSCVAKEQNYTNIPVEKNSKSFATEAKAHEGAAFCNEDGSEFAGTGLKIVVSKPSDAERKEFLAAIKTADKDFKDTDKNLLVYEVHLIDEEGNVVYLSQGKVDFTLSYPNDTLKKNYAKYNYTVYHQLPDKSIDTRNLAIGGKNGITVTTDSFSMFAVASTPKPKGSDNPKTGDANIAMNIAVLLAALSMVSFAGVYAKNKAEQY